MDFGDFDVDAYLQLPLNTPNVPTSPVTPMVPISPTAAVLHPASNSVDILYDDFCQGDDLNQGYLYQDDDLGNLYQDDDLYQGNLYQGEFYQEDLYQGDLYQDDSLYHQDDDLQIDYYGETAPEMSELDWLPQNAIELTGLNHPSIDAIDAFVQANLNDPTPDDVAEQYLNSTDLEYGHQDRLTNEANDPHMSDHIPSLPDGTSQEDSLETKEDNSSENHAAIKDLRRYALVLLQQRNKLTL